MSLFKREVKGDKTSSKGVNNNNIKQDFSERKAQLTPLEYRITQERQTERPFSNKYNRHWEPGTYHCVVCQAGLFQSNTKFESKSGWPAFSNVVNPQRVKLTPDVSHIGGNILLLIAKPDLARTEVSCANCNAHLGHLFKDGPKPTGLRYCINSSSLIFIPSTTSDRLESENNGGDENEFPCNPANSCGRSESCNSDTSDKQGQGHGSPSTKSQILPPMATLCLNNQSSCQRLAGKPPPPPKPTLPFKGDLRKTPNSNNATDICSINSSSSNSNSVNKDNHAKVCAVSDSSCKTDATGTETNASPFTRTSSARFSAKGASLTAARISFFQKLTHGRTDDKPSDSESPSVSSNPGSRRGSASNCGVPAFNRSGQNRFVNSLSSGSLINEARRQVNRSVILGSAGLRRNSGGGLFTTPVEQISKAPVPVRETAL